MSNCRMTASSKKHPIWITIKHPILDCNKYLAKKDMKHPILDDNNFLLILEYKKHPLLDDYCTNFSLHKEMSKNHPVLSELLFQCMCICDHQIMDENERSCRNINPENRNGTHLLSLIVYV